MKDKKRVEYVPPNEETIHEFARDVCKAIKDEKPDTIYGLAGFLNAVARALANRLNSDDNQKG